MKKIIIPCSPKECRQKAIEGDFMNIELNKVYNMDCLDLMREMERQNLQVDLTITSPPYDNMRTYNGNIEQWTFDKFKEIAKLLYSITKLGGVVVWIVGDQTIKGSESGTSFKQALYFKEIGFNLHDTMIYEKAQSCFGSHNCYLQAFEYMFVFSKGRPKTINLIRDRKNIRSGKEFMAKGGLSKDGEKKERIKKEMKDYGKRKNIWKYGVGGGKTGHPAVFPEKLAKDHIISWSNENDLILDPFMGSFTTAVACHELGRRFIGAELDEEYYKLGSERLERVQSQISIFDIIEK